MTAVTPKPGEWCPQSAVRRGPPQGPPPCTVRACRPPPREPAAALGLTPRAGPPQGWTGWTLGARPSSAGHTRVCQWPPEAGREPQARNFSLQREAESTKPTTEDVRIKGWCVGTGRTVAQLWWWPRTLGRLCRQDTSQSLSSRSWPRQLRKAAQEAMVQGGGPGTGPGSRVTAGPEGEAQGSAVGQAHTPRPPDPSGGGTGRF